MRFWLVVLATLVTAVNAAELETVRCADADGEMTFSYKSDYKLDQPIVSVDMQLTDDFGFSTDPAHPDHDGEYVFDGFKMDGAEGGSVSWNDDTGSRHHAMEFRIGRVSEARDVILGGVVAVGGGGLWNVSCTSDLY